MADYSNKVCCVVDTGPYVELALTLSRSFGKVYYHSPWVMSSPRMNFLAVGDGFREITRANHIFTEKMLREVDLWVFPHIYFWDVQEHLRSLGKRVWGAGFGENLETYRDYFKEQLQLLKQPVVPFRKILGLSNLRKFLEKNEDKWVKVSLIRGDAETFHSQNSQQIKPYLDLLQHIWGPLAETIEFIVEDSIDAVEGGWDAYGVDGQWPDSSLETLEVKDCCTLARFKPTSQVSAPIRKANEAFSDYLSQHKYRGFWGTEVRVDKKGIGYFTDVTCREANPPGPLYTEMFENLPDILWAGADGELVNPRSRFKYGIQVNVYSSFSSEAYQPFEIEPSARRFIKLAYAAMTPSGPHVPPDAIIMPEPDNIVGAVIGMGNTIIECVRNGAANAKKFTSFKSEVKLASIGEALDQIAKGRKAGFTWTDDPLPSPEALGKAVG